MLLKNGSILLNQGALEKIQYHFFYGLIPTTNKDLSLWPKVNLLKNKPELLQEKEANIKNVSFFFVWFYWIFNIHHYREDSYVLAAYASYEAYLQVRTIVVNEEYYIVSTPININRELNMNYAFRSTQRFMSRISQPPSRQRERPLMINADPEPPHNPFLNNIFAYVENLLSTWWSFEIFSRNDDESNHSSNETSLEFSSSVSMALILAPPHSLSSSYSKIKKALPRREDAYLVNSFIASRLYLFDLPYQIDDYLPLPELKKAWRKKLLKTHPDRATGSDSDVRRLNAAYKYILGEIDPNETEQQEQERRIEEIRRLNKESRDETRIQEKEHQEMKLSVDKNQKDLAELRSRVTALQDSLATSQMYI